MFYEYRNDDCMFDRRPGRCAQHSLPDDQPACCDHMEIVPPDKIWVCYVSIKKVNLLRKLTLRVSLRELELAEVLPIP